MSRQARRDWRRVGLYFAGVLLLSPLLAFVLSEAWATRGFTYHVVWRVVDALGVDIYAAILFLSGTYLGWLGLLWLDAMKRKQAALLSVATLLLVVFLRLSGRWSDTTDIVANVAVLPLGIVAGVVLGGGIRLLLADPPYEFPAAARELFWFVAIVAVLGLFERHLLYTSPIQRGGDPAGPLALSVGAPLLFPVSLLGVVLFLLLLRRFVTYRSHRTVALLSPPGGGQTSLVLMLYNHLQAEGQVTRDPEELVSLHNQFVRNGFDTLENENRDFEFTFNSRGMFPQYVTFESADARVGDLSQAADQAQERSTEELGTFRSLLGSGGGGSRRDVRSAAGFLDRLFEAEAVLVLLPIRDLVGHEDRYENDPPTAPDVTAPDEYLDELASLIEARRRRGSPDIIPVATMADLLVDEYESDYEDQYAAIPSPVEGAPSFAGFVRRQLQISDYPYTRLLDQCDDDIYPVWFHLTEEGQPERTPDGVLKTEGVRELVGRLSG